MPPTVQNVNPNDANSIKSAYSGYAGWNDPNSIVADFKATNGAGKGGPAATGGGGAGIGSSSAPTVDLNGVYTSALKSSGVDQLQTSSDQLQSQIESRKQALASATSTINDNPFYSEATRTGRVAKLNADANADINNLVSQQQVAQGKITSAKADAQVKLGIAQNQYNIDDKNYQDNLNRANTLLTSGALDNASPQDIAQLSQATGLSTSMVQSIIDTSKAKNTPKPTLQTIDDGTNQKVVAIDQNGNVINEQILGQSKPTKGGGTKPTSTYTDSNGNPTPAPKPQATNKYLPQATKYLAAADTAFTGKGTADKKLSKAEASAAYEQILALVGNDSNLADAVFNQAMNAGGYSPYGNW